MRARAVTSDNTTNTAFTPIPFTRTGVTETPSHRRGSPNGATWISIDAAARAGLEYDASTERGVVFHLMGALSDYGKLGAVCIAPTREGARALFSQIEGLLPREAMPNLLPALARCERGSDRVSYLAFG